MHYIDSHAHLTGEGYSDVDIARMMKSAQESGVDAVINICTNKICLERAFSLPLPHNVAALTPHDAHLEGEEFFSFIEKHVDQLVAIGETGLDLVNSQAPLHSQISWFKRHIRLAVKYQKPLVIHCRGAFKEFFEVLDEESYQGPLLVHCFTGTREEALEVIKRGFFISFSGILTFKKSEELREVAKVVPLERILIETDAPWLAPQSKRGQINEPGNVVEVAEALRNIKQTPVSSQIYTNTRSFFDL
ncbi:MAG: TatD family hydrolase [Chlamydiota bacterium]